MPLCKFDHTHGPLRESGVDVNSLCQQGTDHIHATYLDHPDSTGKRIWEGDGLFGQLFGCAALV